MTHEVYPQLVMLSVQVGLRHLCLNKTQLIQLQNICEHTFISWITPYYEVSEIFFNHQLGWHL